ncbi:hypothetical protein [Pontibacter populi]|uniref:DUF3883 domain-containing protein n=1 Tax=Pontibacter populi TaxID=890055 RepID=A0ABV1RSM0_9BACT
MLNSQEENKFKVQLISTLTTLVYNNIYCSNPKDDIKASDAANALEKRLLGFRAELDIKQVLQKDKDRQLLDGGFMLPTKTDSLPHQNSVYFTVSSDAPDKYIPVYENLSKLDFLQMFFVTYSLSLETWSLSDELIKGESLLVPNTECLSFIDGSFTKLQFTTQRELMRSFTRRRDIYKAEYSIESKKQEINKAQELLKQYSITELQSLVAERYIYDGIIGGKVYKGMPADIDLITFRFDRYNFIEVKEKDLSKREPIGFGMDVHRLSNMLTMEKVTQIPYFYIVKHVNNQRERIYQGWKYVRLKGFEKAVEGYGTINGGMGMSTKSSEHPTLVAPKEKFIDFPSKY